jgi:orotate phosphoribosyltransferase
MESFCRMLQDQCIKERSALRVMIAKRSLQVGRKFKLSSGAETDVYIDAKRTAFSANAMPLIGRAFLHKMTQCGWQPQAIGGRTVGADPIALATSRESVDYGAAIIDAFVVRKEPKGHGMKQTIEGVLDPSGMRVVIVDDVCTGGGSTGDAITKARDAGMIVLGAICLVDREQGAAEFLEKEHQIRLESIFKLSEIVAQHAELNQTPVPVGAHS